MTSSLSRRNLFRGLARSGLALVATGLRGDLPPAHKFTMDLVCGNLGVSVKLPEAIALAHRFGFESVAPDLGFLKSISESQLSELREEPQGEESGLGSGRALR